MTKKDFQAIAFALRDGQGAMLGVTGPLSDVLARNAARVHASTCRSVADVLARQNGKFQRVAFLNDCGVAQ